MSGKFPHFWSQIGTSFESPLGSRPFTSCHLARNSVQNFGPKFDNFSTKNWSNFVIKDRSVSFLDSKSRKIEPILGSKLSEYRAIGPVIELSARNITDSRHCRLFHMRKARRPTCTEISGKNFRQKIAKKILRMCICARFTGPLGRKSPSKMAKWIISGSRSRTFRPFWAEIRTIKALKGLERNSFLHYFIEIMKNISIIFFFSLRDSVRK